ncbi:MAG: hypothetical protein Hyperionvirus10_34 [Hyperionvirus sp.]|uniref:Uncharacterized protein n=1 Tax=Hyperionvirus sp. TaxID=2487770 RepID=A0A3G5A8W8_9VIRU|nr:MAG: hypothetical protein Hyperionvirus10_34 [Hyperionvirus sp.]
MYAAYVWKTILNHKEEIKSISLPGSKILSSIRFDIALFDKGMEETRLPIVLQHLIRSYTTMRQWYFESIISRVQNDAIHYGESVRALLSIIGRIPRVSRMNWSKTNP